jgi:flagellar hook protein FlgE
MQVNNTSMQAHSNWLNSTANNVANINSDNYSPSSTTLQSGEGNQPVAVSAKGGDSVQLSKEATDMIASQDGFSAQVAALKVDEQMMGTLLDIKA